MNYITNIIKRHRHILYSFKFYFMKDMFYFKDQKLYLNKIQYHQPNSFQYIGYDHFSKIYYYHIKYNKLNLNILNKMAQYHYIKYIFYQKNQKYFHKCLFLISSRPYIHPYYYSKIRSKIKNHISNNSKFHCHIVDSSQCCQIPNIFCYQELILNQNMFLINFNFPKISIIKIINNK